MIYVASPYTHEKEEVMEERYEAVAKFCAEATMTGYKVFSPICHWHPIAKKYGLPKQVGYWRDWNMEMLYFCKALWVLTILGYKDSTGILGEVSEAITAKFSIHYVKEDQFSSFQPKGGQNV